MHLIRFSLGLRPRPLSGSLQLQRSPNPLVAFKGATSNVTGREIEEKKMEGNERGRGEGRKRKGGEDIAYSRNLGSCSIQCNS